MLGKDHPVQLELVLHVSLRDPEHLPRRAKAAGDRSRRPASHAHTGVLTRGAFVLRGRRERVTAVNDARNK